MDHPYSFWADLLSKFQGSPPWIQALCLVLLATVVLGVVWCMTDFAKSVVAAVRRQESRGRVSELVPDAGRWVVYLAPVEGEDSGDASRALAVSREDRSPAILPPRG